MGAVEELQASELYEGDVAAGQFHLKGAAVARGAEQDGLLFQEHPGFTIGKHLLDDAVRLIGLVLHRQQLGTFSRLAVRPEVLGEAFPRQVDNPVGGCEDRLGRTVVAVERDDLGRRRELLRKVENVADRRRAERVDRLRVVANDRQAAPVGLQGQQHRRLELVGILIFIDEDIVEPVADIVGEGGIADHLRPIEKQVIVVEDVLRLLGLDVAGKQLLQLLFPASYPRVPSAEHFIQSHFRVHCPRIDRQTGALGRKPTFRLREAEFVAYQVDQVGAILAVVNGELRIQSDLFGIDSQQPCADTVKGPRP